MAFELIFKEKYGDKADGHIKELLKNREIGRMEDVPHLDENGKTVLRKLSILQIIGLALEGPVLKGGEELHFSFGKDTQEKYRKESMEVLKAALFGKDGELQSDDQELRNNLATAISVIGAGYFHVIKQEEEYKNESGELLKFYNHASESRKRAQEDNQALLKISFFA